MKVLGQAALLVGTLSAFFTVNVTPARAQPSIPPRVACEALAGVNLSAELGTPARVNAAVVQAENRPAPVCHLSGTIHGAIGFEAWLPLQRWTGRYLQIGCGGLSGRVSTAAPQAFGCLPTRAASSPWPPPT